MLKSQIVQRDIDSDPKHEEEERIMEVILMAAN